LHPFPRRRPARKRMAAGSWQLPAQLGPLGRTDLLDCTEVPSHQKIPFILCGYRPAPKGPCSLCKTVFSLHNETGNMWTHLVGVVYFSAVALQFLWEILHTKEETWESEKVWVLFLILASDFCLACSFSYHLCKCAGQPGVHECTFKLDLTGIVTLVAVSYFTGVALAYRCFPVLRAFYLVYSGCVAIALAGPLLNPRLVTDMTRHFIFCVALGVVPAAHFVYISPATDVAVVMPYMVAMFGCYGAGAWFYVGRWPERRWPGRFDLVGHSHQLWHVFVLLAALSWVHGSFAMLEHFTGLQCSES